DRPVERPLPGRQCLHGSQRGLPPPTAGAGRDCAHPPGRERAMPDVPDPPDTSRGSRELTASPPRPSIAPTPGSGLDGRTGLLTFPTTAPPGNVPAVEPVLVFERVSKFYGPVIGVNQVTLELRPGITGLVGSNGAGKSTLMRLAAGQAKPDLGNVLVCGLEAR